MKKWIKIGNDYKQTEVLEVATAESEAIANQARVQKHIDDLKALLDERNAALQELIDMGGGDSPAAMILRGKIAANEKGIEGNEAIVASITAGLEDVKAGMQIHIDAGVETRKQRQEREKAEKEAEKAAEEAAKAAEEELPTEETVLSELTVKQLKQIAKEENITVSGNKSEIIATLNEAGITKWPK